jgi:hypothetical protein
MKSITFGPHRPDPARDPKPDTPKTFRERAKAAGIDARSDGAPQANTAAAGALVDRANAAGYRHGPPRFAVADPIGNLPEAAANKLRAFRAHEQDIGAAIRELSERRGLAIQAKTAATIQVDHLRRSLPMLHQPTWPSPADRPSLKQAVAQQQDAARDLAELDQRITALRAKRWPGFRRLEDYVAALPAVVKAHADPVEHKIGKGGLDAAIATIRETVARLGADIHATRSAAHPAWAVKERMVQQIEALAEQGAPNVCNAIEAGLDVVFPMLDVRGELTGFAVSEGAPALKGWSSHSAPNVLGIIAWMFKDQLTAAISAEIDSLADDDNALDDEARAENIASLQAARLEAERIEEALIEMAAAEGRTIIRRPQADCRAVLGLASELPTPRS